MTVTEITDLAMSFLEDVSALDTESTDRRARVVQWLNETIAEVWYRRDWAFSYTRNAGVLSNLGTITPPADFLEVGVSGGLYLPNRKTALIETHMQDIQEARETTVGGLATRFAVFGGLIYTDSLDATDSYVLWYRFFPDILAPEDSADIPIPAAYHNSVLVAGLMARSRRSKGDSRGGDWERKYQEGLSYMILTERKRKSSTQFMPMAVNNW